MTTVLIHPLAGVLSAYGMGLADVTAMRESAVEAPLADDLIPELDQVTSELTAAALAELKDEGVAEDRVRGVRVGKLIEIELDDQPPEEVLMRLSKMADEILAIQHAIAAGVEGLRDGWNGKSRAENAHEHENFGEFVPCHDRSLLS